MFGEQAFAQLKRALGKKRKERKIHYSTGQCFGVLGELANTKQNYKKPPKTQIIKAFIWNLESGFVMTIKGTVTS